MMFKRSLTILLAFIFLSVLFIPAAYASTDLTGASAVKTYYKVTSTTVSLRSAPKNSGSVLEKLTKGMVVLRADTKKYSGSGLKWYKVQSLITGKTGYVSTKYIAKTTAPNFSRLHALSFGKGVLCPAFSAGRFKYDYYLEDSLNEFTLSYTALIGATVQIKSGDTALTGNPAKITFEAGKKITVSVSGGGKTSVYEITMKREDVSASKLKSVTLSHITLSGAFAPDTLAYTAAIPYKTLDTTATVKKYNAYATLNYTINGKKNPDNYFPLMIGKNSFKIECVSPLGKKTAYSFEVTRAKAASGEKILMSGLERRFVETAFMLLPERHPFVLAYEEATGRDIQTFTTIKNGVKLSGLPFEFGGTGDFIGFSSKWWNRARNKQYPVVGLDCAEYMHWIYKQLGYDVKDSSSELFLSGVAGVSRKLRGVRSHKVIPSLSDAKIGDIAYNSKDFSYKSGHGNHTAMFIGTARELGIEDTIRKYYRDFPVDAYLMIDIGWGDGTYYHNMLKKAGIKGRTSLCGVGIQFFTSIKGSDGKYIYKSPYLSKKKSFAWKDSKSGQTFSVSANLERNRRLMQYKVSSKYKQQYIMNLCRPIIRND
jgi:hypothetical protein